MALETHSIELSDDVTLQYVEQGDAAGVPVLFLHGISDSWHSFELVLPHLPETIRAFALTQRGHGDSSRPDKRYRARDFAADAAAFMDERHLEAAFVVGHSMGSVNAQRFAIDHPERTLGLVLVGSFASLPNNPVPRALLDEVTAMEDPVDPGFVREFQASTLSGPVPRAFWETIIQESLKLPARVWKEVLECNMQDDLSGELHKIEAPALIVWGDRDEIVRREQETLAAEIRNSRLVVYQGAGHGAHWEQPERFASDLASFVEAAAG
jgi:non-heme chloroperoxidase